jgi:hypothetical protein
MSEENVELARRLADLSLDVHGPEYGPVRPIHATSLPHAVVESA